MGGCAARRAAGNEVGWGVAWGGVGWGGVGVESAPRVGVGCSE